MLLKVVLSFALSVVVMMWGGMPAFAQRSDFDAQILNTTFNQMPPFAAAGIVPSLDPSDAAKVGYDPGRVWAAGQLPSEVVKVGDIDSGLGASQLTIGQIADVAGINLSEIALENLDFLRGITLAEFLGDVPFLGEWDLDGIPELSAVFGAVGTINDAIAAVPTLAQMEVLDVLGSVPVAVIPNLELAQLGDFEGIGEQVIANIPGLGDLPLGSFPNPATLLNFFAKQDIVFGADEYAGETPTPMPVSGTEKLGFQVPCIGGCAHVELTQPGWEGAQWMTKAHRLEDGSGLLGSLFGEAGAYRLPFGDVFALQITNTDEATGTAEWGIAFRVCAKGLFFDLGCTAYFLEVPLGIETHENDLVLTGLRDGRGGASSPVRAPPGWEALRPEIPPELKAAIAAHTPSSSGRSGKQLCGEGPGGINLAALAEAFSQIEGDYGSIGIYVNLSRGERGRGLGKYQYMSYREDVRAEILKSGGAAFLDRAYAGHSLSSAEMLKFFPPDVQDALFIGDQVSNIEKIVARGYEGERILEILGQVHYGGINILNGGIDGGGTDGNGRLSIYQYGIELRENYQKANAAMGGATACGEATGTYRNPTKAGFQPGSRRFFTQNKLNPANGSYRPHYGDDIPAPLGALIVAADGGTVGVAGWTNGGFGNLVSVDHGDGRKTLYAHLHKVYVKPGETVSKGDVVGECGSTGNSTGPHLHFETHVDGSPKDPALTVDYSDF